MSRSSPAVRRSPMERTLSELTSDLLALLPTMTEEERRLGLEIYRQLASGEPVIVPSLARALAVPVIGVTGLLARSHLRSLTYHDEAGREKRVCCTCSR